MPATHQSIMAYAKQDREAALRSEGYSASDLRSAGYSASQVLSAGYSASDLRSAGYSASQVLSAGYSASDLRSEGYSASQVLSAGYSASDLRSAGYSASDLRSAGYSASDLRSAGYSASEVQELDESIPFVNKPYSKIWEQIKKNKDCHRQSTFGPEEMVEEQNICKTPMCTAGHLVAMGGAKGWNLKEKFDFRIAAALIHYKAHPNYPLQNFDAIPQDWAIAYIKEMAEREAQEEAAQ
jgi:hypothetical protein